MPITLNIHTLFDLLAVASAILAGAIIYRWKFQSSMEKTAASVGGGYFFALSLGSIIGSFGLGTLNLYLSNEMIIGRSILGTVFGAIIAVEIYKLFKGTKGSTGYIYIIPFCTLVTVGRLGCFFSGLDDHTYGTVTSIPWGMDFGDGQLRHPAQLYESASMALFAIATILTLKSKPDYIIQYGFYICVGFYAAQRFVWEFFKPYGTVMGSLNIFHIVCLALIVYSVFMSIKVKNGYRAA